MTASGLFRALSRPGVLQAGRQVRREHNKHGGQDESGGSASLYAVVVAHFSWFCGSVSSAAIAGKPSAGLVSYGTTSLRHRQ